MVYNNTHYKETIIMLLDTNMPKHIVEEIFHIQDSEAEVLLENIKNISSEAPFPYDFNNLTANQLLEPFYRYYSINPPSFNDIEKTLYRISNILKFNDYECAELTLQLGVYAEKMYDFKSASFFYSFTIFLAENLSGKYKKRLYVKSVIHLSKLEFMRGISPEKTLTYQKHAIKMINQSNLVTEDALLYLYAGMSEHFNGVYEEGEILRNKGIKYLNQFDYSEIENEVLPLIGWHYYLEGDFKKCIAHYESMILAIEKRELGNLDVFAYPPIIFSYFFIREPNRALALAKIIFDYATRKEDKLAQNLTRALMGRSYLYLDSIELAEKFLNESYIEGNIIEYGWGIYYSCFGLIFLALKHNNYKECKEKIIEVRKIAEKYNISPIVASPFMLEALKKIKDSNLGEISGYTYEIVLNDWLHMNNEHLRGVAHRYNALDKYYLGHDPSEVINELLISIGCLESSGSIGELRETYLQLAKIYHLVGDHQNLTNIANQCWNYSNIAERQTFPKEIFEFIRVKDEKLNLEQELNIIWYDLRTVINKEMLEARLLTSLCRLFGMESGCCANITNNGFNIGLSHNLNLNSDQTTRTSQVYELITRAIATIKPVINLEEKYTEPFYNSIENNLAKVEIAIPFIFQNRVETVIYLSSLFESVNITDEELQALKDFGIKMGQSFGSFLFSTESELGYGVDVSENNKHKSDSDNHLHISSNNDINHIYYLISKVASTNIPVLITGETGVGKEVFAQEVYKKSNYKNSFIKINCAAIPENLIESELFGYEKGSFTGASQQKKGYFEMAKGGTIFLDEIGEMSLGAQVKLLRILQEYELIRIGGSTPIKVDFRLIAATNKDLNYEINRGNFRMDLFYRLNVVQLNIPPLRKRRDDILQFTDFFIRKFSKQIGKPTPILTQNAITTLLSYDWPGNIRELENTIQRAVLLAEDGICNIKILAPVSDLGSDYTRPIANHPINPSYNIEGEFLKMEEMQKQYILSAIKRCNGKIGGSNGAAHLLGMKRTTLISRMKKLEIENPFSN